MKLFNLPRPIVIAALMSFLVAGCSTANFIVSEKSFENFRATEPVEV
jgi:hypothetical protein